MEYFIVICRADVDQTTGLKGSYVLTTRRVFSRYTAALEYAATINTSREAIVVSGRFAQLRFDDDINGGN